MTIGVNTTAQKPMIRLACVCAALMLALLPLSRLQALGLGESSVSSAINEPLVAEIELLNLQGLEESELIVSLGSAADYDLAGVRWNFFHTELNFDVDLSNPANPVIRVTSDSPVVEPYLNFIIQARWPSGRLLREYTMLLDIPVFSGEQVTQTQTTVPTQQQRPTTTQPTTASNIRTTPSPSAGAPAAPTGTYRVEFGDTLWEIAENVAASIGVTHSQAMLAIRDLNREAFFDGNMNRIMSGSLLRIPTASQITVRDAGQARAQVASELGLGDATPIQAGTGSNAPSSTQQSNTGGQFRLATADEGGSTSAAGGTGSAVNTNNEINQLVQENTVLEEQLDAVQLENADLVERLARLEEQIEVFERLLEVEGNELNQAQTAAPQTALQPVVPAPVQQLSLMDRLMGWAQWIGIGLVGLLLAAYLVIKRRSGDEKDSGLADFQDQDDLDEIDEGYDRTSELDEELEPEDALMMPSGEDDADMDDEPSSEAFDLPEEEDSGAGAAGADDEDDDTDFDDLDAFFSGMDGKEPEAEEEFEPDELIQDEINASSAEEDSDSEDGDLGDLDDLNDLDLPDAEPESAETDGDDGMNFDLGNLDTGEELAGEDEDDQASDPETSADADDLGTDFDLGGESDDDLPAESDIENQEDASELETDDSSSLEFNLDTDSTVEDSALDTDEDVADAEAAATDESDGGLEFSVDDFRSEAGEESDEDVADEDSETTDDSNSMDFESFGKDDTESADLDVPEQAEPELEKEEVDLDMNFSEESDESEGSAEPATDDDTDDSEIDDLSALTASLADDDLSSLTNQEEETSEDRVEPTPDDSLLDLETEDDAESIDEEVGDSEQSGDDLQAIESESAQDDELEGLDDLDLDLDLSDDDFLADGEEIDLDNADTDEDGAIDECATKLELAEAYIDMSDETGAKALLKDVLNDGSDSQKSKAQELLDRIK